MLSTAQKPWISPFVAVTYATVAITGLLLLLHLKLPGIHQLHQWGGVLFVVGGTLHLMVNWRILLSYFHNTKALWGALAGVLTMVLLVAVAPHDKEREKDFAHGKGQTVYGNKYRR